ncbi:MAG: hypothetical protein PHR47_01720 [Candidatus Pacebacteria bacterium]|nr:hypothetical protein [Candidatus Paceibacterota bacterium]
MLQLQQDKKNKGFIALMMVLIISAIGLAIAISLLSQNNLFLKNTYSFEQMEKAKAIANACSEEALLRIKNNPFISGFYDLNSLEGHCSYNIFNNGGVITIESLAVVNDYTRKVNITVQSVDSKLEILSFEEGF